MKPDEFENIFNTATPIQKSKLHETMIMSVKPGLLNIHVKEKKYVYTNFADNIPIKNIISVVISDEYVSIIVEAYGHSMGIKIKLDEV